MELEELLQHVDIVDYISQYVDLTEKNGEYWGLSPFKEEKTPSFSVRRETGRFYDFSSGIGGNAMTFIRLYKKCSRRESLEEIKRFAGYDGKVMAPVERLDATKCFKKYSYKRVPDKQCNPTILQPDYMDRYEIRKDKLTFWENEGISEASLRKFNVRYDPFYNSLVYPIYNLDGKIVNVGTRTLDPKFKEKGMHKYGYSNGWGGSLVLIYGMYENMKAIKEKHEIILFEGCKSVMLADTWGVHNTGCLLTSHLNPGQMKLLIKLGCDVTFMLDKEVRIKDDHNIQKLKNYVNVFYYYDYEDLLQEKDAPVDRGKETFMKLYEGRLRFR